MTGIETSGASGSPMSSMVLPALAQLGFGGLTGWAVGFFFKKSLKLLALLVAVGFITVQLMIHFGYIPGVDWLRLGSDFSHVVDRSLFETVWHVLTENLPFGAGFGVGFVLGFRKG